MIERVKNKKVKAFLQEYAKYADFVEVGNLLEWEAETYMPLAGTERRGKITAAVDIQAHSIITSKSFEDALRATEKEDNLNETEKAIIKRSNELLQKEKKIPENFVREYSEQKVKALVSWRKAKQNNDFKSFEKDLAKNYEYAILYADIKGYQNHPYDALLDDYEIGMDVASVTSMFAFLVPATKKILQNLKEQHPKLALIDGSTYYYDPKRQDELSQFVMRKLGLSEENARLDTSAHPFTQGINTEDARITTHYLSDNFLSALSGTIHESGHAFYELGTAKVLKGTPLQSKDSVLGLHESQSRSWENFIGRSLEFCEYIFPLYQAYFPHLLKYSAHDMYDLLHYVTPSLIRTEANQVHYNMHIALRFEIEKAIIEKQINIHDLPTYWNEKMKEYVGVEPSTDTQGVLQDIHWSMGSIGYFPSYTVGNIYAAQLMHSFLGSHPTFFSEVREGNFSTYLHWLQDNVHQYGILYDPKEIVKKATGEDVNPQYLVDYLEQTYSK